MKQIILRIASILQEYKLVVIIYLVVTVFFLFTSPNSLLTGFQTLLTKNTLIKMVTGQQLILGGLFGFLVLILLHFSIGTRTKTSVRDIIPHLCVLIILIFWSTLLLDTIYLTAQIDNIIKWSAIFMNADKTLFGLYPGFFMLEQHNTFLERTVVTAYNCIPALIALWTGFLIASRNIKVLVVWSRDIFLALALCFPLWISFPAMEPLTIYVMNIFQQPISSDITRAVQMGKPSIFIRRYFTFYRKAWVDPTHTRHAVSTFPSMHTIWGFLLLWSVSSVFRSRRIKMLLFILACANFVGAIYTLQHYAVDILASMLVLAVMYLISRKKLSTEA